jgi:hypothetical protein
MRVFAQFRPFDTPLLNPSFKRGEVGRLPGALPRQRSPPTRIVLVPVAFIALVCGFAVYHFHLAHAQNSPPRSAPALPLNDPSQVISEAAAAAYTNQDEASVDNLAKIVFNVPFMFSPRLVIDPARLKQASDLQNLVVDIVRKRLVHAELTYLRNGTPVVEEQAVADTLNMAADRFGAPDTCKFSTLQVHYQRMALVVIQPYFMGRGIFHPDMRVTDPVDPRMSPLQAGALFALLVNRKIFDKQFQVAPAAWDKGYAKLMEDLQVSHDRRQALLRIPPDQRPASVTVGRLEARTMDENSPQTIINQAVASMTEAQGAQLLNDMFHRLGIE